MYDIEKTAVEYTHYWRPSFPFSSARRAFQVLLELLGMTSKDKILLPAYIGWSSKEGSGVFDPILLTGVSVGFYRMTRTLEIDMADLESKLKRPDVKVLVLIHYFGFPDKNAMLAAELAGRRGILVLEDEAHAMYSDWVGGCCGRWGDFCILSLHKMLPSRDGGLLVINHPNDQPDLISRMSGSDRIAPLATNPLQYDLAGISAKRCENYGTLGKLMVPLCETFEPLRGELPEGVVPQTFPIIVKKGSRDQLYHSLNARGYGVVSLYHTLISQIDSETYADSHWLSQRVCNLPIHQDVTADALERMVAIMTEWATS
jgi:dTDP-4-amino-4,6-dideoxygalactose transaminase